VVRVLKFVLIGVLLFFLPAVYAVKKETKQPKEILFKYAKDEGDKVQLYVNQIPLVQLLKYIEDKTAIAIHYRDLPNTLISGRCIGFALEDVLNCLLERSFNMIFRYPTLAQQNTNLVKKALPKEI